MPRRKTPLCLPRGPRQARSPTPDSITALPCRPLFAIVVVGVALQDVVVFSTLRRPGLHQYRVQLPAISGCPGARGSGCPYCMLAGKRMRHVLARPLYIPLVHIRHGLERCCATIVHLSTPCLVHMCAHSATTPQATRNTAQDTATLPQHTAPKQGTPPNNGHFASHRATSLAPLVRPTAYQAYQP